MPTSHSTLHTSHLIIHTDGGSRGNPGPAATGIVVLHNNQEIHAFGRYLGTATNNVAEYSAVLDALQWIISDESPFVREMSEGQRVKEVTSLLFHFKLDSKLVVEQLSGRWKVKEPSLQNLKSEILNLIFQNQLKVDFEYVPRAQNWQADREVNRVLDNLHE